MYPQVQDLYPLYPPSQACGLCQNFKQTTLTTRLYKVRTNLYPFPTYENVPTRLHSLESIYRVSLTVDLCKGNKIISFKQVISPQPVGGPSKINKSGSPGHVPSVPIGEDGPGMCTWLRQSGCVTTTLGCVLSGCTATTLQCLCGL